MCVEVKTAERYLLEEEDGLQKHTKPFDFAVLSGQKSLADDSSARTKNPSAPLIATVSPLECSHLSSSHEPFRSSIFLPCHPPLLISHTRGQIMAHYATATTVSLLSDIIAAIMPLLHKDILSFVSERSEDHYKMAPEIPKSEE